MTDNQPAATASTPDTTASSEVQFIPVFLLLFFLGFLGLHRFYAGKTGTGILMLLTLGGLGIWVLIDFILVLTSNFTDKDGNRIVAEKKLLPIMLLCVFSGFLGIHRFYVGKVTTGVLQILTLGGLMIWVFIDFVLIIIGKFTDKEGNAITEWT